MFRLYQKALIRANLTRFEAQNIILGILRFFGLLLKQCLYVDRYIQSLAPEIDMFGDDRLNPLMLG